MTSFCFLETFLCFRVRIRFIVRVKVRIEVRVKVSGNTFSVKRPFGQVHERRQGGRVPHGFPYKVLIK